MSELVIELPSLEEQTEFNLRRWEEVLADPELAKLEYRVETDRHGQLIMSPPPGNDHSFSQSEIYYLLRTLLPEGKAQVEVPISTRNGVRAADVSWTSEKRWEGIFDPRAYREAPDICVEVLSPSNTKSEIAEKKMLYFDAGAKEVWICDGTGKLEFFHEGESVARESSALCAGFPSRLELN
ncbi:MAG: Uma2 family endonuclease [Verrucomicrobiota bacterium]